MPGPVSARAAATSGAVPASMGCTGRRTSRPISSRPGAPRVSATIAVRPRSPLNMAARRTRARGTDAALATASAITPSSAPWRSSPRRRRLRNWPSGSVAAANRAPSSAWRWATEPAPVIPSTREMARSTSAMVSVAVVADAVGRPRTADQPTPTRPWRGLPTRNPTAASTSPGSRRRSRSASAATLAVRLLVPATDSAVATSSANSTSGGAGRGQEVAGLTCRGACRGPGPSPCS